MTSSHVRTRDARRVCLDWPLSELLLPGHMSMAVVREQE